MVMWQFNGKYMILAATCYMNHIRSYARVLFRPFELTRYTVLLDARVLSTADITDHADVAEVTESFIIVEGIADKETIWSLESNIIRSITVAKRSSLDEE